MLAGGSLKSNLGDVLRATVATRLYADWVFVTDAAGQALVADFLEPSRVVRLEALTRQVDPRQVRRVVLLDNHRQALVLEPFAGAAFPAFVPTPEGVRPANRWIAGLVPYQAADEDVSWQECLVRGLGQPWTGQDYPDVRVDAPRWDVGLNSGVHPAWTSKSWPQAAWEELEERLRRFCRVSRQQGAQDLAVYKDWLRSCRIVVTCDSLGLHLASAYRRHVVVLAGPTHAREFPYGRVQVLSPRQRDCLPCHAPVCTRDDWCMRDIAPATVAERCRRLLEASSPVAFPGE